jgi:hypothetical protein
MKKLNQLLLGIAALAFTGGAQAADLPVKASAKAAEVPKVSGVIGSFTGGTWVSGDVDHSSQWIYGGEARVNWWFAPNWSIQTDLEAEGTGQYQDTGDGRIMGTVGKHLTWRDPSRGALGILGGYTMTNILAGLGSTSRTFFGGEGQLYLGNFTLYGQGGGTWFHNSTNNETVWDNAWFIRGVARWFITPNDKLQGEIGYASGRDLLDGDDPNVVNWGMLYERNKFLGTPFSAYLEYAGFRYKQYNDHITENLVMVGMKIYFNQDTLLSNDRTGATFDMPKFMRAQAWSGIGF